MAEIIQGNARMEDESFLDYKERQKREAKAIRARHKGAQIWDSYAQGSRKKGDKDPVVELNKMNKILKGRLLNKKGS